MLKNHLEDLGANLSNHKVRTNHIFLKVLEILIFRGDLEDPEEEDIGEEEETIEVEEDIKGDLIITSTDEISISEFIMKMNIIFIFIQKIKIKIKIIYFQY